MMTTGYLEPGGDLVLTPNGSIQLATGWDEVRQRILRRLVTNPLGSMVDGTPVPPDYIFDTAYGDGLPRKVGGNYTADKLSSIKSVIINGVLQDSGVNQKFIPTVEFIQTVPDKLWAIINLELVSGEPGTIAIQVSTVGVSR